MCSPAHFILHQRQCISEQASKQVGCLAFVNASKRQVVYKTANLANPLKVDGYTHCYAPPSLGGDFEGGLTPAAHAFWEGYLSYTGDFYRTCAHMCSSVI